MDLTLSAPSDVVAALSDAVLVPHGSADPSTGPTMQLRAAMARFSEPNDHPPRRRAVEERIAGLTPATLRTSSRDETAARLVGETIDVLGSIALIVPTVVLWRALDLPMPAAIGDLEAIVRVIGRGEPASAVSDLAAERLLSMADVATVSLLYQDFDATAALIATTLSTGAAAVPRTRRLAVADTFVGGRLIAVGTNVILEIGPAGRPFGAGPHECPGRAVAEAITAGVVDAFDRSAYRIDASATVVDADDRPTHLVARRRPR